ncbi:MAG: hypothetical protein SFY67_07800 [Candidatus Melainabacteria bacterium]|nr:hypothetical protein [Candidatus Melainabacteria bacterium]
MKKHLSKLSIFFAAWVIAASPSLADTHVVDEKHLQEHRVFEKKNLEQQRFKTEIQFDSGIRENLHFKNGLLKESDIINTGKKEIFPPTHFSETHINYFSQFQLNQSGVPLEPTGSGRFECEPSFWKTWQGFDYIFPIPPKNVSGWYMKKEGESSIDLNIVAP